MNNIELYKRVKLVNDYSVTDGFGNTITYKKGIVGIVIDYCDDLNYVIVELHSNEYKDNIPAIPISILEYI